MCFVDTNPLFCPTLTWSDNYPRQILTFTMSFNKRRKETKTKGPTKNIRKQTKGLQETTPIKNTLLFST